jgi:hypothetical protein
VDVTARNIAWTAAGVVEGGSFAEELAEEFAAAGDLDARDFATPFEPVGNALAGLFVADQSDGAARITKVVVRHADSYTTIEAPADAWWLYTYRAHVAVVVVEKP